MATTVRFFSFLLVLVGALGVGSRAVVAEGTPGDGVPPRVNAPAGTATPHRTWPLWFEPAAGDSGAFVAHGAGYHLALSDRGASVAFGAGPVHLAFDGGRAVRPLGEERTGGVSHHYIGNDPSAWRRDVPHFARVRYPEVYPGIDALFYAAKDGSQATRLEYDFVVAPGADPNRIALRFSGASSLEVLEDGSLAARVGDRAVVQRAPVAFQDIDGARRAVDVAFALRGDTVGFTLGAYDPRHTLTIDPIVVVFGTFVGGSGDEFVDTTVFTENGSVAVDASGNTYLASDSTSPSVLGIGAPAGSGTNVFVAKLNAAGSAVEFVTFLGGSGEDARARLALDEDGNILVAGRTRSTDLLVPSPNAVKGTPPAGGVDDGFLIRLNSLGVPTFATYLGGSGSDTVEALAVRGGLVAVAGSTDSATIALTANAAQSTLAGSFDAWVAVIDPGATPALVYGSYLGGSGLDFPKGVALDASGRVLLGGATDSTNFPTARALQADQGGTDGFLARLVPGAGVGASLDFSSYFGGSGSDGIYALALDTVGQVVVAGTSSSSNLPVGSATAYQPTKAGAADTFDAFVARLVLDGTAAVTYRTYFGGAANESALAVAVDDSNRILLAGYTGSNDLPSRRALQNLLGGGLDAFVGRLSANGATLEFSTYLGGSAEDLGLAVATSPTFGVTVLGFTRSALPAELLTGALDGTRSGTTDGFVIRLDIGPTLTSVAPPSGSTLGGTIITISGADFVNGSSVTVGGVAATGVVVQSSTTVLAVTPPGAAGARDVVVTSPLGGSDTLAGAFTYVTPASTSPTITSVTPSTGVILGGQAVTVAGTNFVAGARAFFGAAEATVTSVGATALQVTTPANPPGAVAVSVVNPDTQSATLANGFTYATDFDGDAMDDTWEVANGLDPRVAGDATLDPDDDGANNRKEFQDGTDPRAAVTRYFAEGASNELFRTRFALFNDDPTRTATVEIDFLVKFGGVLTASRTIPPLRRITLNAFEEIQGLQAAEFSTTIRSNLPIAADRTMTWNPASTYGAHAETAIAEAAATWYLAEGATINNLQLFYLIQNPNPVPVQVNVKYLLSGAPPVEEVITVDRETRETVWVNQRTAQGVSLNGQQLSAVISAPEATPIIVERALYRDPGNFSFPAGHESAGVTTPGTRWLLAEGSTGTFDQFVLIANPNDAPANVTLTYLLPDGAPLTGTRVVSRNSRDTVWLNYEPGLASTPVSTIVTSDVPIIVERAMWWPATPDAPTANWFEAHNSAGAQGTARKWLLAEGESGIPNFLDTYILLANTSSRAGRARVTLVFEDGTPPLSKEFDLGANSRKNVRVGIDYEDGMGDASIFGKTYGAIVESLGADPVELVVERAMYWSVTDQFGAIRQFYGAGTNSLATPR